MTHPLYSNRISTIKNKARTQIKPITNSTNDYFYIKNILASTIDGMRPIEYLELDDRFTSTCIQTLY